MHSNTLTSCEHCEDSGWLCACELGIASVVIVVVIVVENITAVHQDFNSVDHYAEPWCVFCQTHHFFFLLALLLLIGPVFRMCALCDVRKGH